MGLNRTALEDKARLRPLAALRAPAQHASREPAKGCRRAAAAAAGQGAHGGGPGSPARGRDGLGGYKIIGMNSTPPPTSTMADRGVLGTALHRAIRYLTELLFRVVRTVQPAPGGHRSEIHQLYRYSELLGIAETPLDDPLNGTLKQVSIGHAYKQALLLDFADPYHLPAHLLARIYRYLDRFAALATLTPEVAALKSQCQFLINSRRRPGRRREHRYRTDHHRGALPAAHHQRAGARRPSAAADPAGRPVAEPRRPGGGLLRPPRPGHADAADPVLAKPRPQARVHAQPAREPQGRGCVRHRGDRVLLQRRRTVPAQHQRGRAAAAAHGDRCAGHPHPGAPRPATPARQSGN
ncbi:MAG: hypothetical protein MZW92_46320 [Comamonadaceae bacterium]|nr:hypothetical protein [Comamonadaceae bacterium]